ncbi:TRAP transporter small permease [Shimia aestuarii]|uniref:TRAP transporter small permease protein n=1 Tax=Shimia aestuarii TaxID=254406 RepID=A0A1I4RZJ9_9RHOB|nr:TRAP transporter small permease [Shimia aestuarii]SFM57645.1 TRAP-type C4-dicarboxylate transport system, small permease component [Shimia aestuarii]
MYNMLNTGVGWLARVMAILGGIVLIGLIIMTCLSITGRALIPLGLGPVPGDFELVEAGVAFAIFAFLPWCQYNRGHARVDLFQPAYGRFGNRLIDLVADVMMFIAAYIIAWRLYLGMMDKYNYHETTFILQFEIWMAYAAGFLGASVFVIVAAFCILRSLRALLGRSSEANA